PPGREDQPAAPGGAGSQRSAGASVGVRPDRGGRREERRARLVRRRLGRGARLLEEDQHRLHAGRAGGVHAPAPAGSGGRREPAVEVYSSVYTATLLRPLLLARRRAVSAA